MMSDYDLSKFEKILKIVIVVLLVGLLFSIAWNYLQRFKEDKVIALYATKSKFMPQERVVVSLWVDEANIDELDGAILSILQQPHRVDMIYVNVAPQTSVSRSRLADKCAIVQHAGKHYSRGERNTMTLLRERESNVVILDINVDESSRNLKHDHIMRLLNDRSKETYLLYDSTTDSPTNPETTLVDENIAAIDQKLQSQFTEDPRNPGMLNLLLSHNLDV